MRIINRLIGTLRLFFFKYLLYPSLRAQFFWNVKYKIANKTTFLMLNFVYESSFLAQLAWIPNTITQLYSTMGVNYTVSSEMCISWSPRTWICLFQLLGWILPLGSKDFIFTYSDYRLNLVLFLKQLFYCLCCGGNTGICFCFLISLSKTRHLFPLGRR